MGVAALSGSARKVRTSLMMTAQIEQAVASESPTAPTAPPDAALPSIGGVVTPKPKKPSQRIRQRRRIEFQAAEIAALKAELAALKAATPANGTPATHLNAIRRLRAERDTLASMLEDAVASLRMYRASNFPKQKG